MKNCVLYARRLKVEIQLGTSDMDIVEPNFLDDIDAAAIVSVEFRFLKRDRA